MVLTAEGSCYGILQTDTSSKKYIGIEIGFWRLSIAIPISIPIPRPCDTVDIDERITIGLLCRHVVLCHLCCFLRDGEHENISQ